MSKKNKMYFLEFILDKVRFGNSQIKNNKKKSLVKEYKYNRNITAKHTTKI